MLLLLFVPADSNVGVKSTDGGRDGGWEGDRDKGLEGGVKLIETGGCGGGAILVDTLTLSFELEGVVIDMVVIDVAVINKYCCQKIMPIFKKKKRSVVNKFLSRSYREDISGI